MRLFLAIDLPHTERIKLRARARHTEWLGTGAACLSWVREANLHVTLKFLGEVSPAAQN